MFNLKGLIASAAITACCLGNAPAADAAYRPCWFGQGLGQRMERQTCWITSRTNANGHIVHDITDPAGNKGTIVLWRDQNGRPSYGEIVFKGRVMTMTYTRDADGSVRLFDGHTTLVFR